MAFFGQLNYSSGLGTTKPKKSVVKPKSSYNPWTNIMNNISTSKSKSNAKKKAKPKSGSGYYIWDDWRVPEQSEADAAFINPFGGANNPHANGYQRYDENAYGAGTNAETYAQGARGFANYQRLKPSEKGYENAQNYLKTLKHMTGLSDWKKASPKQLFEAMDYTQRGYQEDNQKTNKFTDGAFGKILSVAAPIAGALTGNPYLAAAGGAIGGGAKGGLKGALIGGALGGGLSYASKALPGALAKLNDGKGYFGIGGVGGLGSAGTGTAAGTAAKAGAQAGFGLAGLGGEASDLWNPTFEGLGNDTVGTSLGGGLSDGASFFGNLGLQTLGAAAGGAGGPSGGNPGSGGGGSGVGFFDNLISGVTSPSFLGNLAGDLIGGGINYYANERAADQSQDAYDQALSQFSPEPYALTGPAGGGAFSDGQGAAYLSPELQRELNRMYATSNRMYNRAAGFDQGDYAQKYYETLSNYARPGEERASDDFYGDTYNVGQWGSRTGAQNAGDFNVRLNNADQMRRLQADEAGHARRNSYYNDYFDSVNNASTLARTPYDYLTQGAAIGAGKAQAGTGLANAGINIGNNNADATSAWWGRIAAGANDLISGAFSGSPSGGGGGSNIQGAPQYNALTNLRQQQQYLPLNFGSIGTI